MSDEPKAMALRCTAEDGEHPLDEHGRVTLADPDGDVWAWRAEDVVPWISAEEQDKVRWLIQVALEISGEHTAVRDALTDLQPLRDRLGWP